MYNNKTVTKSERATGFKSSKNTKMKKTNVGKKIHGGEQYKLLGDVRRAWFDVPLLNYTIANMKQNIMQFYLKKKKNASIDTSFFLFSFLHNLWLRHCCTCPSEKIKQKQCSSWRARSYKLKMSMSTTRALKTRALTSCREAKNVFKNKRLPLEPQHLC